METAPRQPTILVAEDNRQVRTVIEVHLTRLGYRVVSVSDGDQAVVALRADAPEGVILDQVMPGKSGSEVCEVIRADATTADLPVIMLTGRSGQRDVERGFAAGADEYLTKPFDMDELVMVLGRLMAARH